MVLPQSPGLAPDALTAIVAFSSSVFTNWLYSSGFMVLDSAPIASFDTETNSLDPLAARLVAYAPFQRAAVWLAERLRAAQGPRYRRVPPGTAAAWHQRWPTPGRPGISGQRCR